MTKRLFICYVNVVLVSLCGRFVAVLVCGRFGLWPFWMYAHTYLLYKSLFTEKRQQHKKITAIQA